jgi:hypothetical protein
MGAVSGRLRCQESTDPPVSILRRLYPAWRLDRFRDDNRDCRDNEARKRGNLNRQDPGYPAGIDQASAAALQIIGMDADAIGNVSPGPAPFPGSGEERDGIGVFRRVALMVEVMHRL